MFFLETLPIVLQFEKVKYGGDSSKQKYCIEFGILPVGEDYIFSTYIYNFIHTVIIVFSHLLAFIYKKHLGNSLSMSVGMSVLDISFLCFLCLFVHKVANRQIIFTPTFKERNLTPYKGIFRCFFRVRISPQ
jgi:hypothetical protein